MMLSMMWLDSLILGALQGVTEFLPISSSGHLVLGEQFLGLKVEALKTFDIVVHMGTLLAILVYFAKDIRELFVALFKFFVGKLSKNDPYGKLILLIIVGTLPAVIAGFTLEGWIDENFRNVEAVAVGMLVVGFVFLLGEFVNKKYLAKKIGSDFGSDSSSGGFKNFNLRQALIIGCAQAIALLPGVSRSGSTIVAGIFQGIDRSTAARFSFLLAIPAIAGAGILTAFHVAGGDGLEAVASAGGVPAGGTINNFAVTIGFFSSFIFGLLSIWGLMKFLKKHTLHVFAFYLIVVGMAVLIFA